MTKNFNSIYPYPPGFLGDSCEGFALIPILLHPRSTGSVELRSSNPLDRPIIHPGYFTDERDLHTFATGMLYCQDILQRMDIGETKVVFPEHLSGRAFDMSTCREYIRNHASTTYHPTSTCAMGKVIDSRLRVCGVKGLRVADASSFPHIVSGNTNAPCMMLGEMAADFIKEEYVL
jgi:choline dehydrogenase